MWALALESVCEIQPEGANLGTHPARQREDKKEPGLRHHTGQFYVILGKLLKRYNSLLWNVSQLSHSAVVRIEMR